MTMRIDAVQIVKEWFRKHKALFLHLDWQVQSQDLNLTGITPAPLIQEWCDFGRKSMLYIAYIVCKYIHIIKYVRLFLGQAIYIMIHPSGYFAFSIHNRLFIVLTQQQKESRQLITILSHHKPLLHRHSAHEIRDKPKLCILYVWMHMQVGALLPIYLLTPMLLTPVCLNVKP